MSSKENNPGNFANRPKEEVREAARKGGEHSHSGPASAEKQSASKDEGRGMSGNSGQFEPGSERTRQAGRKGGRKSGRTGNQDEGMEDDDNDDDDEDYTQQSKTE
ncbi:hypothetical protein BGZ72_004575 [Mortierella alpina]|nr:hypothetical protein BGZ72_004575 [Mortierella alpina]